MKEIVECACGCGKYTENRSKYITGHWIRYDLRRAMYNACGHSNWRKCMYCKGYDDPKNLHIYVDKKRQVCGNFTIRTFHKACSQNARQKILDIKRKKDALAACGNENYLQCKICKLYDHPGNLIAIGKNRFHDECAEDSVHYQRLKRKSENRDLLLY
jgi:hypothetical protein